MADNVENIVIEMIKGLRNDVATLRTEMHDQFGEIKQRILAVERGFGRTKRDTFRPHP
jgi:hypothetical protein